MIYGLALFESRIPIIRHKYINHIVKLNTNKDLYEKLRNFIINFNDLIRKVYVW